MNDGVVRPKGYCAGWRHDEQIPSYLEGLRERFEADRAHDEPLREKFHTDGHASAEEAVACFYAYCLDHLREFSARGYMICDVCEAPTSRGFDGGHGSLIHHVALCDAHRTLDHVRAVVPCQGADARVVHS